MPLTPFIFFKWGYKDDIYNRQWYGENMEAELQIEAIMMRHHEFPDIGGWYANQEFNDIFEVVASDEKDAYVEIQYFNGEIEEFDLETWYELDLRRIPEPEDCSGPFEVDGEALGYSDDTIHPEDWSDPLANIEPDQSL